MLLQENKERNKIIQRYKSETSTRNGGLKSSNIESSYLQRVAEYIKIKQSIGLSVQLHMVKAKRI